MSVSFRRIEGSHVDVQPPMTWTAFSSLVSLKYVLVYALVVLAVIWLAVTIFSRRRRRRR